MKGKKCDLLLRGLLKHQYLK